MTIVSRYLTRLFLGRCIAVLLALAALLQLLDLLDSAGDVLERGGGMLDLARFAGLRLPVMVERLVPLAVLIGTLLTLWSLAQANEVTALRSAGLTPYQLLAALLPAASAVALFHLVLSDQIAPRAERAFIDWWVTTEPPKEQAEPSKPLWFRLGDLVITANRVMEEGHRLEDVKVFRRDETGLMTEQIIATAALHKNGAWTLVDGKKLTVVGKVDSVAFGTLEWPIRLYPANILELTQPVENLSVSRLRAILKGQWSGSQSPDFYLVRLHETYAGPLASLVMLLLAAPVAHGLRRRGGAQGSMALGIIIGLTFLLTNGMMGAMGEAGVLAPLLAVWSPIIFFAAVGGAILVHVEG